MTAGLDPATSRWLSLVKWLLVLPHLVVLAFLWLAVTVTTFIAGDEYPPFRFDTGGDDPGHVPVEPPPAPQPAVAASAD